MNVWLVEVENTRNFHSKSSHV